MMTIYLGLMALGAAGDRSVPAMQMTYKGFLKGGMAL